YSWNTGQTTQIITTATAGTYSVFVANSFCISSDTLQVELLAAPEPRNTIDLCGNAGGVILDAGYPGATYLWNTGETTQRILAQNAGTYSVTITVNNCILIDSVIITGEAGTINVFVPNSFSPNNDGLNDVFIPKGEDITSFNMIIFNRWGEIIAETNNLNAGWNGTYKGVQVQEDVYVYRIQYTSNCTQGKVLTKTGHVLVTR
ncbi:MAG: gliding motility-associated C-terminal domain-containing protein, partial [Bacteroidia bacterium]